MAYRQVAAEVVVADDSSQDQIVFRRKATAFQTADNEVFNTVVRVVPAAAEAQIAIAPVAAGYFVAVYSDYPVMIRFNSAGGTQFVMSPSSVSPTYLGAPTPDQCCFIATAQITSVYLEPIASASSTANVRIVVTGDPTNAY